MCQWNVHRNISSCLAMAMMCSMIQIEDVHKSYRQGGQTVSALRGVDLKIDGPGFFAIMGASGSGKSTLLHLLGGLDQPDSGRISIDQRDITTINERKLTEFRRKQVGIVFQQFNLISTLTAHQNVALPGLIDGQPRKQLDARVDELLEQLGLSDRATHRPDALSGGEQQRVAIARALLFDAPLLLADEPTGNLDSASSDQLWTLLGRIAKKRQMTVVMVTHEPAAASHCQTVFVLGDGQVRGSFEVNDLDSGGVASCYQQLSR
jgi:putative ABC transport system ATP-binding protein